MTKCNFTHPADKDISSHFKFICSINNVLPTQRVFVKVKDTHTHTHTHTHKNAECWKTVNGGKEISFQETSCWGKMSERKRLTRLKYSEFKWTVCLKSKVYNMCDTVCFSLIILLTLQKKAYWSSLKDTKTNSLPHSVQLFNVPQFL